MSAKNNTDPFKETIQSYLNDRALQDELFAETLKKENKSIDECLNYIYSQVQKSGRKGFTDPEIYGMAVHYYDEDDIKPGKLSERLSVIVNHHVELTSEEIEEARKKAMDIAINEKKEEIKKDLIVDVKLSDDEIAAAKKEAVEKLIDEQRQKITKKQSVKKIKEIDSKKDTSIESKKQVGLF